MESIFQQILSMSFTSSIVILVVLVVRFFLKKSSRNIACILWLLVALRLVLPITFESSFSLMPRNVVSDYVVSTNTKADKINNKQENDSVVCLKNLIISESTVGTDENNKIIVNV